MRYRIEAAAPAAHFEDAFPLGNGTLGAMVHGRPGTERIDLNVDTLWSGGPLPPPAGPPPSCLLPELRSAIAAGDHARAEFLARELQGSTWTESYQPVGHFELAYAEAAPESYGRSLDLASATAVTSYAGITLTAFVCAPDGVLVLSATGPGVLDNPTLTLRSPHPGVSESRAGECRVWTGRAPSHVVPSYIAADDPVEYGPAGMGFAVAAGVQRVGAELRVLVTAVTGYGGFTVAPSTDLDALAAQATARLQPLLSTPTPTVHARHVADYRSYFQRADLDLSPSGSASADRAELLFHLGRYLLIASSRPGTQPANLQGIWNADVRPGWSSNWTTNINAEMNYWPAEPVALGDLHEPLLTLARDLSTAGEVTARHYYAARGAAVHHNTDLWRHTAPVPGDPQWSNWPSALLWLCAHAAAHADFGAPRSFATQVALPMLRAAAAFTLDMLVPDARGELVFSPSTSPEHHFRYGADGHAATSWGAALDQELAREVLTRFVALEHADAALRAEAQAALAALRPVPIGPDGTLLEWYDDRPPREPGHRHLSHLYGLYPGTRITETGTPADFAAARRALLLRLAHGTGHTGWSRAWVVCLAARLRDPRLAATSIAALHDDLCSASLLSLHPDAGRPSGWIFQIDGNLGVTAGIAELLVQSHAGAVSLLPALPPDWPAGTVRGLRCRGGHRITLTWSGGRLTTAVIQAGATGDLIVELPDGTAAPADATPAPGAPPGRRRLRWAARAGARYRIA